MNEQLQQALALVISDVSESAKGAISFLSSELPEVVSQLLLWKFVESLVLTFLGIITLLFLLWGWVKYSGKGTEFGWRDHKITLTHDGNGDFSPHIVLSISITSCIGLVSISAINLTWLQIAISPKLFLIEYAIGLVK